MKILIADDHELFLRGLEMILADYDKTAEIVTAKNYTDIFSIMSKSINFDLILTDLAMPGAHWLEAIEKMHKSAPETPIIILSAVFDREIVQKTLDIGAAGYIPKTSSREVIISAVNLVLSGGVYIPAELLHNSNQSELDILKSIENISDSNDAKSNIKILSPRQIDVLKLIAAGKSNKQIAYDLKLTEGTVKLHVTAILRILGVYNRTGAVTKATSLGILNENEQN